LKNRGFDAPEEVLVVILLRSLLEKKRGKKLAGLGILF